MVKRIVVWFSRKVVLGFGFHLRRAMTQFIGVCSVCCLALLFLFFACCAVMRLLVAVLLCLFLVVSVVVGCLDFVVVNVWVWVHLVLKSGRKWGGLWL